MSTTAPTRGTELIGRQAEQRAIAQVLDEVQSGRPGAGQVILLSGEPGIGKSSLARWAAAHALELGLPVYWGFAWEAGGAPPYWPWTQCLRALLQDQDRADASPAPAVPLAALAQLLPELAAEGAAAPALLQPEQARFQLLEAVRGLLAERASRQAFVLVLEDLHAADRESLYLLQHVCQHAAQGGFLLLGTFRELEARLADESSPLWRCAREALLLPLKGLDEAAVGALLERRGGRPSSPERLRQLLAATEGNPLYLNELLAVAPGAGAEHQVPGSLQQVILQHLESLPRAAFETLAAASVLGREFDTEALANLLQQGSDETVAKLEPAVQASLLRATARSTWRFAHQFHREALYACLDPDRRRLLHLRRATALQEAMESGLGEAWAELAEHYLAAGQDHRKKAVEAWRSAARRAGERLAFTESAALFERALETFGAGPGADPAERCELLLQAACAVLRAGEVARGHALCLDAFHLARTLQNPLLMARSALAYGSAFVIGRVDPELARLLRESLAALGAGSRQPDSADQAARLVPRLQARLAAALQPADDPAEPIAMAFEAIEGARASGDRRTLYETLTSAISALMDFAPAEQRLPLCREYARLAESFDDVPAQFRAHTLLLIDGLESADATLMETSLDRCEKLAARIGLPHYQWRVHSARALLAMIRGDLDAAGREHDKAQRDAERAGDPVAMRTLAIQALGLLAEREEIDADDLRAVRREILAAGRVTGGEDVFVRPMIALQLLRVGDDQAALTVCSPATAERLLRMREMSNLQLLGECTVRRADRELAQRVYDVLREAPLACGHSGLYGMTWNGPAALTLSRLAALLGDAGAARGHLEEALEVARRIGARRLAQRLQEQPGEQHGEQPGGQPGKEPRSAAAAAHQAAGAPAPVIELIDAGEFWQVRYGGRETTIRDSKGMRILARLLAEPGREFHALDLNSPAGSAVVEPAMDEAEVGGLDDRAREAYRLRLAEIGERLQEARERGDSGSADALLEEQEALQRELARAYGLGGRKRRSGSAAERARVNVTRRLRDAIGHIGEQLPDAGRYLDNTIKTGTYCKYSAL